MWRKKGGNTEKRTTLVSKGRELGPTRRNSKAGYAIHDSVKIEKKKKREVLCNSETYLESLNAVNVTNLGEKVL